MRSAYRFAWATGMSRSSSGATTSVGAVIRRRRRSSFGSDRYGTHENRASDVASRYAAMIASMSGAPAGAVPADAVPAGWASAGVGGGSWNSIVTNLAGGIRQMP